MAEEIPLWYTSSKVGWEEYCSFTFLGSKLSITTQEKNTSKQLNKDTGYCAKERKENVRMNRERGRIP